MVRGLWQGAGLLVLLLAVYAGAVCLPCRTAVGRHGAGIDLRGPGAVQPGADPCQPILGTHALARQRGIQPAVRLDRAGRRILLAGVLTVPAISRLFSFATPLPDCCWRLWALRGWPWRGSKR